LHFSAAPSWASLISSSKRVAAVSTGSDSLFSGTTWPSLIESLNAHILVGLTAFLAFFFPCSQLLTPWTPHHLGVPCPPTPNLSPGAWTTKNQLENGQATKKNIQK
jgi:hypothetical protein